MTDLCAYCGQPGRLTREHLMPACIHDRTKDYAVQFHKPAPGGFVGGETKIKDVCTACNSNLLSPLDDYACSLYDAFFARIVQEKESVQFVYNYDLLARWLLKVSYNYARANKAPDVPLLAGFVDYILYGQPVPNNVAILVQLIIPEKYRVPAEGQGPNLSASGSLLEMPPTTTGISQANTYGYSVPLGICRRVQLNSYCFYLISSTQRVGEPEGIGRATITKVQWEEVLREIQADIEGTYLLPPNSTNLLVPASDVSSLALVSDHVLKHYAGYKREVDRLSERDKKR